MKRIISAASAASIIALTSTAAMAADLGGNCCADLEERVAELEATTARKGNRKVSVQLYGAINASFVHHDAPTGENGVDRNTNSFTASNPNSASRFGFKGSAKINSTTTAGFLMEIGVGGVSDNDLSGANTTGLAMRHAMVYINRKGLGSLKIGQTSSASDGISEINLASNSAITLGGIGNINALLGVNDVIPLGPIADLYLLGDGNRTQGIHFVSDEMLGGVNFSASTTGDDFDVAMRYAAEHQSIRVAFGVGYRKEKNLFAIDGFDANILAMSGSVMHVESGLFAAASYTHSDFKGENSGFDVKKWSVTGGIHKKFNEYGATNLSIQYSESDLTDTDKASAYSIALEQHIDAAAMSIYLAVQRIDLGNAFGPEWEKTDSVIVGAKMSF